MDKQKADHNPPLNASKIISMASAFYDSCTLFAASDLGIFTALSTLKNATAETISEHCNLSKRGARLLLDACVALDLLTKENGVYANTPDTNFFLTEGSPGDLSKAIRYNRDVYDAWGKLPEFIKTGAPVEKPSLHLGDDETRTRTFVMSMHGRALGIGQALIPLLDLQDCINILDIGGGPGTYSVLAAQKYPDLHSSVLDLPEVVAIAAELIEQQGMQERIKTIAGSYRTSEFPVNNDALFFFGVLHQESPESIKNLMQKGFNALKPGGKVFIMDLMTDHTHTWPPFSALFAVNMALTTENGWVFSDRELKGWLAEAGFKDTTITPLPEPMPHWLVWATKY